MKNCNFCQTNLLFIFVLNSLKISSRKKLILTDQGTHFRGRRKLFVFLQRLPLLLLLCRLSMSAAVGVVAVIVVVVVVVEVVIIVVVVVVVIVVVKKSNLLFLVFR